MRLAGQRVLAELVTIPFTDEAIEALSDALEGLGYEGRTVGQFVGPEVQGQRMLMQLRAGAPQVPWSPEDAALTSSLQVPQRVEQLIDAPPQQSREVLFGWVDPGVDPDRPLKMSYKPVPGAPPLAAELRQAQAVLMERAGMQRGDLLVNAPVGLNEGDYDRAIRYMRAGYGPPTRLGDQIARVGRGGELIPEMITNVHPGLARKLGWQLG